MKPCLIVIRAGRDQAPRELSWSETTLGRGPDCDIRIEDDRVSTRHCRIFAQGDDWFVQDAGSVNHTFVNDERVDALARRLAHGDRLRLGTRESPLFEARFTAPRPRTPTPPLVPPVPTPSPPASDDAVPQRDAEIARLRRLNDQLQAALRERARQTPAEAEIAALRRDLDELHVQLGASRDEIAALRERRAGLEHANAQLEAGNHAKLNACEQRCRRIQAELAVAVAELAAARQVCAELHARSDPREGRR